MSRFIILSLKEYLNSLGCSMAALEEKEGLYTDPGLMIRKKSSLPGSDKSGQSASVNGMSIISPDKSHGRTETGAERKAPGHTHPLWHCWLTNPAPGERTDKLCLACALLN